MARPKRIDIDPANVDADGITVAETLSGGGAQNFTIGGALTSGGVATFAYATQILQTAVGNESARTFTITGTDADGNAQTEALTGANATTGESTKYFLTVTSITSDDDTANDVSFGTVDEVVTKTIPLNWRAGEGATYAVDVTGTIDYTVQECFQDIQNVSSPAQNASWHNLTALAAKTADLASIGTDNATAVRLVVNSYTDTAEIQFDIVQN